MADCPRAHGNNRSPFALGRRCLLCRRAIEFTMNRTVTLFLIAMLGIARPMAAQAPNPFLPPQAKVHYEPERQYDLQHVKLAIKLDWANRRFSGRVTHRLELYRPASGIRFDAGPDLKIKACSVNGQ